jgi:hypothetical protein
MDQTTTVAETGGKDTTCVNTVLSRDVGHESFDKVQIVDGRIANPTWVALPCVLTR